MLTHKDHLKNKKNLLAFSAGVDSTALFFLLLQEKIDFDIAIVDYNTRQQSKEETLYAQTLAKQYNLTCHTLQAPPITNNFEAKAREIRYQFFEQLINQHHYNNLLTAHHLGDRFEWMLMQFCKGAGCVELCGLEGIESKDGYKLIRPLLHLDKEDLLAYLHTHKIKYFHDSSNDDEKYKRNTFRKHHAQPLLKEYKEGILKSFAYLDEDRSQLITQTNITKINQFAYFPSSHKRSDLVHIDRYFKSINKLLTYKEKELLKHNKAVVIGRQYIVVQEEKYIFIAPYKTEQVFTKKFKEQMRLLKIEPKLRGYLAEDAEALEALLSFL